jgi:hypothetical protein
MTVFWTPLAETRAAEIIASMVADRTGAAWRWQYALLSRIQGLARGAPPPEGIYETIFAPCRIVYRVERDRMVVLTLHAVVPHRKSARYEERPPATPPSAPYRS